MGIRHKKTKKCVQSCKGIPAEVFVSVLEISLGNEGFYPTRGRKSITSEEPEALSYKSASLGGRGGGVCVTFLEQKKFKGMPSGG